MIWGLNPADAVRRPKGLRLGLIASMYVGNIVAVVLVLLPFRVRALMRIPSS